MAEVINIPPVTGDLEVMPGTLAATSGDLVHRSVAAWL